VTEIPTSGQIGMLLIGDGKLMGNSLLVHSISLLIIVVFLLRGVGLCGRILHLLRLKF